MRIAVPNFQGPGRVPRDRAGCGVNANLTWIMAKRGRRSKVVAWSTVRLCVRVTTLLMGVAMKENKLAMTQRSWTLCAAILALAALGGCDTPPQRRNEQAGMVIGALAGGLLGSQV